MVVIERNGNEKRKLMHKNDKCVGCGICVQLCPTQSLELGPIADISRGKTNQDKIKIEKDSCVLCGLCASVCAFDALNLEIDGKNIQDLPNYPKWSHFSEIDEENCIYCGKCSYSCPQDAVFFQRNLPKPTDLIHGNISINEDDCLYCKICEELCPVSAITIKAIPESSTRTDLAVPNNIEVDLDKCVQCGVCKRACPQNAIKQVCDTCMYADELPEPEITGKTFIDNNCVYCGYCKELCPEDTIKVVKPFDGEMLIPEAEECKDCQDCIEVCPCNALEIKDGFLSLNEERCILCGACVNACPLDALQLRRSSMKLENITNASWQKIIGKLLE